MTPENFDEGIEVFLERRPFTPFTVALFDGKRFEIDSPKALAHRPGMDKAMFIAPGGVLVLFDHNSVSEIIDAPAVDAPGTPHSEQA